MTLRRARHLFRVGTGLVMLFAAGLYEDVKRMRRNGVLR